MKNSLPLPLGITMGDAAGVGPEILVRSWRKDQFGGRTCVVFGDVSALELAVNQLDLPALEINRIESAGEAQPGCFNLIDARLLSSTEISIGEVRAATGTAAVAYVTAATYSAIAGEIRGFVTLPINKEASRLRHPGFQGHTELISGLCGVEEYTMMLASPKMVVTHVSTHVPLAEAIRRAQKDRILTVIRLTAEATRRLRGRARIVVAGLNPHAGEHGSFGTEDMEQIAPAVAAAREEGYDVVGPMAADTLFMKVIKGHFDAAVCMYHDQGHIPMKLHGFADAVNITVGLPVVRTSVDHGTAFDIAYKGIADIGNFAVALAMADDMTRTETSGA